MCRALLVFTCETFSVYSSDMAAVSALAVAASARLAGHSRPQAQPAVASWTSQRCVGGVRMCGFGGGRLAPAPPAAAASGGSPTASPAIPQRSCLWSASLCRLPQSLLASSAGVRHQQHAALPSPRRERCCRVVARAAAPEAPAAATAEPAGKGRSGASGIGSGIKLENVRSRVAAVCRLVRALGCMRCTCAHPAHPPSLATLPPRRWPSPSRTNRCSRTSAGM